MNRFDAFIIDYLYDTKEVALEKIGIIKTTSLSNENQAASIEFTCNKRIATSDGLIDFIAEKSNKNRHLIASDLESYLSQVREFINIGKSYEIPNTGFIKANNAGIYEFIPYSEAGKLAKTTTQPVKEQKRTSNRSIIQLITFLIVIAILSGIGWQAYQFIKTKNNNTAAPVNNNKQDTVVSTPVQDTTARVDSTRTDSTAQPVSVSANDTVNVRYIFETTASILRAQTRTAQLKTFGNNAGYDSLVNNNTKFYTLYILKRTKVSDTLTVKDSISRFLQKDIKLQIEPVK